MKLQIKIPAETVEKIVRGIMDNFPEASSGCELRCIGWQYAPLNFTFEDSEGKRYLVDKDKLLAAFPLIFTDKWPKGCTPPPAGADWEQWEDWLCQSDAVDGDAFVQLAILGEVIYG